MRRRNIYYLKCDIEGLNFETIPIIRLSSCDWINISRLIIRFLPKKRTNYSVVHIAFEKNLSKKIISFNFQCNFLIFYLSIWIAPFSWYYVPFSQDIIFHFAFTIKNTSIINMNNSTKSPFPFIHLPSYSIMC